MEDIISILKRNNIHLKIDAEASSDKENRYILEVEEYPKVFGMLGIRITKNKLYYYSYNLDNVNKYLDLIKGDKKIKRIKSFDNSLTSPLDNLLSHFKIDTHHFNTVKLSPKAVRFYGVEVC